MSILSFEFIFFALIVLIAYYLLPLKARWVVLLLASAVFMAFSGWQSIAHLTVIALISWGGSLLLSRLQKGRRILLALLLVLDLGVMGLIKYQPAVAALVNRIAAKETPVLSAWNLAAPLGLSYFTFQTAGYLIDVYRRKADAQKNPLKVWLFAGYFPQLAQGPISTWKELNEPLFRGNPLNPECFASGFLILLWGYFKKLVIADRLASTTTALLEGENLSGWFVLGGVILYTLRLYADFSGGMDVVRGYSRMLGIDLPLNFKRPFFSQSVAEYWRRWHITLGAWFRSYLLYPLSTCKLGLALGKHAGKVLGKKSGRMLPTALATLIVFLLIGVWHTANWNAVVYGAYFGLLMAVSMLLDPVWKRLRKHLPKGGWMHALRLMRTWLCVLIAQYFAFTSNPDQGFSLLRQSFANWQFHNCFTHLTDVMEPIEWAIAGLALVLLLIVDILEEKKGDLSEKLAQKPFALRCGIMLILLVLVLIFGIYGSTFDSTAFLYTQF